MAGSWLDNMTALKGGPPPMTAGNLASFVGLTPPSGLDGVTPPPPQPPQPNGPRMNPTERIYQKPAIQRVIDLIDSHPGVSSTMLQSVMNDAMIPFQDQQAIMAQKRSDLAQAATTMAATLPEGQAASALQIQFPQFQDKPIMDKTLQGAYGQTTDPSGLGLLNPSYVGSDGGVSTISDLGKQTLSTKLDGITVTGPTDWKSLDDYRNEARRSALIVGANAQGTQAAIDFAESYWASKAGVDPSVAHKYGDPSGSMAGNQPLTSGAPASSVPGLGAIGVGMGRAPIWGVSNTG